MTGEELKKKLDELGVSYAEVARQLNVFPQSFNKTLKALDVSSGTLEKICQAFGKDMSFFYDIPISPDEPNMKAIGEGFQQLQDENTRLQVEILKKNKEIMRLKESGVPTRASRIYNVWMKFMEITHEMQELYKEEKVE